MTVLAYRIKTASREQIQAHLEMNDGAYRPALSARKNIVNYSCKLFESSVSFEAWDASLLVGLLNAYFNDIESRQAFITNMSVMKRYARQGIAFKLLGLCLNHAQDNNFTNVRLEVARDNVPARTLYAKAGFIATQDSGDIVLMEYAIPQQLAL